MMYRMLNLSFLLLFSTLIFAQQNNYNKASDSDPAAKAVLEKLRSKYENFKSIEADFTLSIEIPEEPVEEQDGSIIQQDEKYYLKLSSQEIYCDGKDLWLFLRNNNEVQINNVDEMDNGEVLSPNDLLRIYEKEEYVYALMNEFSENGQIFQQIEFKPLDQNSEYSKMRLTVNKSQNDISQIKVFSKDGSRYTLTINALSPNKSYAASQFVFDKTKYPGVIVEDLRID